MLIPVPLSHITSYYLGLANLYHFKILLSRITFNTGLSKRYNLYFTHDKQTGITPGAYAVCRFIVKI
jgi:hypothetical protein